MRPEGDRRSTRRVGSDSPVLSLGTIGLALASCITDGEIHWRLTPLHWTSPEFTGALIGPAVQSSSTGTRNLVIVVDDDPSILRAVQRVLQVHGFDTQVFNSVDAFITSAHLGEAVCLVLDVHLQHRSGIELERQLTRSGHSLPVIFITAVESDATRRAAVDAGCVAYLHKPFPSALLIEAVRAATAEDSER
jgi:CheY-like chemotaxis protein